MTQAVINVVAQQGVFQTQVTVAPPSPQLTANNVSQVLFVLGGRRFHLVQGDHAAIFLAHQVTPNQQADLQFLYDMLSAVPNQTLSVDAVYDN